VTLGRLSLGHWVAWLAALALLLVTAMDWYSTKAGEEARRIERISQPRGALGGEIERRVRREATERAESQEKNAWQAHAFVDRAILALILTTVTAAIAAAVMRASGRTVAPPLAPSAFAGILALAAAALVAYRLVQKPGLDVAATIKPGAPIALGLLGVLALAAASALRAEQEEEEEA
jgi:hypothetical protein